MGHKPTFCGPTNFGANHVTVHHTHLLLAIPTYLLHPSAYSRYNNPQTPLPNNSV